MNTQSTKEYILAHTIQELEEMHAIYEVYILTIKMNSMFKQMEEREAVHNLTYQTDTALEQGNT